MKLTSREIQAAYYALAGFIRERNIARRSVPPEVDSLYRRLDNIIRLSSTRHQTICGTGDKAASDVWIGSRAAADMLGMSLRQIQRHATDIGSHRNGGRLFFLESDVLEYAERRLAHARTDT